MSVRYPGPISLSPPRLYRPSCPGVNRTGDGLFVRKPAADSRLRLSRRTSRRETLAFHESHVNHCQSIFHCLSHGVTHHLGLQRCSIKVSVDSVQIARGCPERTLRAPQPRGLQRADHPHQARRGPPHSFSLVDDTLRAVDRPARANPRALACDRCGALVPPTPNGKFLSEGP